MQVSIIIVNYAPVNDVKKCIITACMYMPNERKNNTKLFGVLIMTPNIMCVPHPSYVWNHELILLFLISVMLETIDRPLYLSHKRNTRLLGYIMPFYINIQSIIPGKFRQIYNLIRIQIFLKALDFFHCSS